MDDIDEIPTAQDKASTPRGRPGTTLERLTQGVRDQNWFAVGLELVIVVVGIVIGFQVTAWGEERGDREKEQAYLRQLSLDLAETERRADRNEQIMAPLVHAPRRLVQAYFQPVPPPRDSVIFWAVSALDYYEVSPVLGTAEALVATGDIGLIRDDSLRTAITAYLEVARENIRGVETFASLVVETNNDLIRRAPMALLLAEFLGPTALDSLDRAGDWRALAPPGVTLPALDTDALVRDRDIHGLMTVSAGAKGEGGLAYYREQIRRNAVALKMHVDANLER